MQRTQRGAFFATNSTPEVSRSRRCTSSRNRASGRNARSPSMTPKLNPLPPCTAVPEGLFSTRIWSSSYKMTSANAATFCKCGDTASSSRSATRTGGMRTSSPASSLYSGLMRFCSPAPRLYARCDKSYFLVPLSVGCAKVINALPRFVSGDSNNFYGWRFCFHGGDSK